MSQEKSNEEVIGGCIGGCIVLLFRLLLLGCVLYLTYKAYHQG